jgi:hypothetical protein
MDEINTTSVAKRPFITSFIGPVKVNWLLDSGASLTCLHESIFNKIPSSLISEVPTPSDLTVQAASGHFFDVKGIFILPITINKTAYPHKVVVMRDLAANAIIGTDFLIKVNAIVNFERKSVTFNYWGMSNTIKDILPDQTDEQTLYTAEAFDIQP